MHKRFVLPLLLLFLFFSSVCYAVMTIYFKDGTEKKVHKIVFKGDVAELYLITGVMETVPVSKIDLDLSGIVSPEGTYGETKLSPGQRDVVPRIAPAGPLAQQDELKALWNESTESAEAIQSFRSLQKGAVVRIVESSELAYSMVYIDKDGTYKKLVLDSDTFLANFQLKKKETLENPVFPIREPEPRSTTQQETTTPTGRPGSTPEPVTSGPTSKPEVSEPEVAPEVGAKPSSAGTETSLLVPIGIGLAVVLVIVAVAFILMRRQEKVFLDSSKFAQYEEELREFEIGIWLKQGKTMGQLTEICLKKFFQDSPTALPISMKMFKGDPKGLILPYIMKESGSDRMQAETIYGQLERILESSKQLIKQVSARTGLAPLDESLRTGTTIPPKAAAVVPPKEAALPPAPAQPSHPPAAAPSAPSKVARSSLRASIPIASNVSSPQLPRYAANVLNQLGLLSGRIR